MGPPPLPFGLRPRALLSCGSPRRCPRRRFPHLRAGPTALGVSVCSGNRQIHNSVRDVADSRRSRGSGRQGARRRASAARTTGRVTCARRQEQDRRSWGAQGWDARRRCAVSGASVAWLPAALAGPPCAQRSGQADAPASESGYPQRKLIVQPRASAMEHALSAPGTYLSFS